MSQRVQDGESKPLARLARNVSADNIINSTLITYFVKKMWFLKSCAVRYGTFSPCFLVFFKLLLPFLN